MSQQSAVTRRRESQRCFERPCEVRLIGEPRLACHFGQWTLTVNPLPCELETAHE
jgi:hypothetical protein